MATADPNVLYGFLAFIGLLQVAMVVALIRLASAVGRLEGLINGLNDRINGLESRIERLEEQMANFREQLAEVRGLMRALHDRMDLLMGHHHDDAGRVVIVPAEEVAAD